MPSTVINGGGSCKYDGRSGGCAIDGGGCTGNCGRGSCAVDCGVDGCKGSSELEFLKGGVEGDVMQECWCDPCSDHESCWSTCANSESVLQSAI